MFKKKVTVSEFREIIKEEALKFKKRVILENEKKTLQDELKNLLNESFYEGPQPGDLEYHIDKPENFSGLSNFRDIDWESIYPIFLNNTKALKYKEPIDDITYSVNNFNEIGVSKEDLDLLEDHDIIYIWNSIPIIDNEQYLDFNIFLQASKLAWEKGFSSFN